MTKQVSVEPMAVGFDPVALDDLRGRLRRTRLATAVDDDWIRGVPTSWLAELGDPADAFTVVVPALPGFGFSAPPPPGGLGAADIADMWDKLMTQGLGHQRYVAHGSDLGAGVVAQKHARGGHFPATAEPHLLAQTLREAFRPFRRQHR